MGMAGAPDQPGRRASGDLPSVSACAGCASTRATDAVTANFPAVGKGVNRVSARGKSMDRWLRETDELLAMFTPIVSKRRKAGLCFQRFSFSAFARSFQHFSV